MGNIGFTVTPISEQERLKRLHVSTGGKRACAEGHRIEGENVYYFDDQRLCRACVEDGTIIPEFKREVYFVTDGMGHVKIGIATSAGMRLAGLQVANPYELTLVRSFPGGSEMERALHRKFSAYHIRGEWFWLVPPIVEFLVSYRTPPAPKSKRASTRKPRKIPAHVRLQQEAYASQSAPASSTVRP